ncbi:MAG: SpoIIE family protein phosphatase [Clostridia bacterium]
MELYLENGYTSLNHVGEELCGDKVEQSINGDYTTIVLADGLGSGVKANILSTLTSKILCTMIANEVDIEECVETIIQTLPVCKVRGVAYATFSVVHINSNGQGYMIEFDNPAAIYIHNGQALDFERKQLDVLGKKVYKSDLNLQCDDYIVMMSDGVIHAGIGMLLNFGWQRDDVKKHLSQVVEKGMSARCVACLLAGACNDLYMDKPGDDTTVAVVRIREKAIAKVFIGPPVDKNQDNFYINQFIAGGGKKIVCGGTSSQLVAKYLHEEVISKLEYKDKEIPPIGHIKGIDLTTEGVLTMRKLVSLSEQYLSESDLSPKRSKKKDGASLLANMLFEEATHITFYVGQSINLAHQGLPIDTTMKLKLVETISNNLKKMGKTIVINYD